MAADHMDRLLRSQLAVHLPDQVEQGRVHLHGDVPAPVAHEVVEFLQRVLIELTAALVNDGKGLFGVYVVERQAAILSACARLRKDGAGERQNESRQQAPRDALETRSFQDPLLIGLWEASDLPQPFGYQALPLTRRSPFGELIIGTVWLRNSICGNEGKTWRFGSQSAFEPAVKSPA
jgi:hypothetical protein